MQHQHSKSGLPDEAFDLLGRIVGQNPDLFKQAFGKPTWFSPGADSPYHLTNQLLIAALGLKLEGIETLFREIERKYEAVNAADKLWRLFAKNRDKVTFISSAGTVASLPMQLVEIRRKGGCIDADISDTQGMVQFVREGKVVARIPASLAVVLDEVIRREFP